MLSAIIKYRNIYLMLAPTLLIVFAFSYVPLFGWIIAFKSYTPVVSMWEASWVGFEHFRLFFVLTNDYVYTIKNTLVMNLGSLCSGLFFSLLFAILMNELRSKRFSNVLQVTSMFPFFISWAVTYSLIYAFFAQVSGVINQTLIQWGIIETGFNILGDDKYSWALIIISSTWKVLGYNTIIFIAAIAGIEREQFESAEIDGAGRFHKIWYILLPHLIPTFVVVLILNSGNLFNSDLGQFLIFTNATNWRTMEVLDMYIYKAGLVQGDFSYATAVGIIKTIISLLMVVGVNELSKRLTGKSIL